MIKTNTDKIEKANKKFLLACLDCNSEQITQALAAGANINTQDINAGLNGAMYILLSNNDKEKRLNSLEVLINNIEFDINHKTKKNENILMLACVNPNIDITQLLIKKINKNIINETDNNGDNVLQYLAKNKLANSKAFKANDKKVIEKLIEIGVSVEAQNKQNKNFKDLKKEVDNLENYNSK